jgi:23S rRNA maturation mini-RNase III
MEAEKIDLKFHKTMAQPFLKKANRIEKNLAILKKEKLPEQSLSDITSIYEKYNQVRSFSQPRIEKNTRYQFKNPNLFLIVFLYKEISEFFNEMHNLVIHGKVTSEVPNEFFLEMRQLKDTMMTLAFIGDSAIDIGVLRSIWHTDNPDKIPLKGKLDPNKKIFTEGKNQAILWDFLDLYDSKILIRHPNESTSSKSSLFEAIFGIIYLEAGQEAIESAIQNLKNRYEKNHELSLSTSPGK